MPTWSPGDTITSDKLNLASSFVEDLVGSTTTSTTYANSTRTLSTSITAPASGRVEVILAVRCDSNPNTSNALSDVLIVGSSSGTIYSPADVAAIQYGSASSAGPFITQRQVTCTPGETVTVTAQHRVIANTANYRYRGLTVKALVA
jgi:hypothetical protein